MPSIDLEALRRAYVACDAAETMSVLHQKIVGVPLFDGDSRVTAKWLTSGATMAVMARMLGAKQVLTLRPGYDEYASIASASSYVTEIEVEIIPDDLYESRRALWPDGLFSRPDMRLVLETDVLIHVLRQLRSPQESE